MPELNQEILNFLIPVIDRIVSEPLPPKWVLFVCLIWFFTFHQQFYSYVGMGLPGLNQY